MKHTHFKLFWFIVFFSLFFFLSLSFSCQQKTEVQQGEDGTKGEVKIKVFQIYPSSLTLMVGQLFPLSITAEDESGNKVGVLPVWESSNTSVVFVSSSGVIKALAPGSATVTATYLDLATSAVISVLSPEEYAEYLSRIYQEYGTSATSGGGGIPSGITGDILQPGYGGGITIINQYQYVTYLTYSPGATDILCDLNVCLFNIITKNFGDVQVQNSGTYGNYLILRTHNLCHFINLSNPDSPEYSGSSTKCGSESVIEGDKVINTGVSYTYQIDSTTTFLACSGEGLIFVVPDECMDDGGISGGDDSLEIYCCNGIARFCLSWEDCPWRNGCVDTPETCSRSGLYSDWMATTFCNKWNNITNYYCSADGQVYFDTYAYPYKPYFVYDIYSFSEKDAGLTLNYQGKVSNSGEFVYLPNSNSRILSTKLVRNYLYSITSIEYYESIWHLEYYTAITYYLNVFDVANMTFLKTIEIPGIERDIEHYRYGYAITVHTSPYMKSAELIEVGDKLYLIGAFCGGRCEWDWDWDKRSKISQLRGLPIIYSVIDVSNPADPRVLSSGVTGISTENLMGVWYWDEIMPLKVDGVKLDDVIYVIIYITSGYVPNVVLFINLYYDTSGVKINTVFDSYDDITKQKPFHIFGDRFYLNTSTSVVVFDVSQPKTPKLVDYIFPILQTSGVSVQAIIWADNERIYVSNLLGLQVLDLTGALRGLFRIFGTNGIVFAKDRNVYLMGENSFITLKYMSPE